MLEKTSFPLQFRFAPATRLARSLVGRGVLAALVAPMPLMAQESAAPPEQADLSGLETIVVTGVASAGGVKKLEASYNIVTANEEQIRRANPKSTADLLKISPGMWPETSGGQTGANIEIAGFPGGGDAPYYTTQLMGSPLYGMPTLSFFETSSIFRLDDTIRSTEILQGGPSVVFAGGQMGATSNFLLKTGTETPAGTVGLTYGDENLMRADVFYGFPLSDNWFGSIGGFWRTSDGVRDPQFAADEGGQITATLKHQGDSGQLTLYARYLDDKNQFITPIPVIQHGTDRFSEYPGFDAQTDTYYSRAIQHVTLPGYPNGGANADLANGRGAKMFFFGGNYDQELGGGWSIVDKFIVNGGDVDTNALFSGPNPATLEDELYNIPTNLNGFALPPGSATATFVGGGAVAPDQDVIQQGWWFIHKELKNINNDFRLSKEIFDGNTLTAGVYLAYYEMDDEWSLGSLMLMANEPNTRPITVSYVNGTGDTVQFTDDQGFVNYGGFNITEKGHAFNKAVYLSDSWRVGQWLLDASVRWENQEATNRVCNLSNVNLDGNPLTVYDNAVAACNGTFAITDYDEDFTSWTVGANYAFTDNMSAYVRVNRGGHFLDFDNGIRGSTTGNTDPMQVVRNYEVGYKFQNDLIYADISAYFRDFTGLAYQQTTPGGAPTGNRLFYGSESKGINFIGALTPGDFRLELVANYLDGEYTDFDACFPFTNVVTGNGCAPIEGKQLQRQPKLRYMLTPSYRFTAPWGDIEPFVTYTHVGDRTQDQSGLQQLGSYETWDLGIIANVNDRWQFSLRGTNVTDELGLTESNSRIFGVAADTGGVLLARPIEGAEYNFQARYRF
ncbi:MAG TPA: TonB-dependent receptor [Steroidobacteraceae bacterium]|nr:TonB-dependent receptor [Steroidobacteraceae bacterium]